MKELPSVRVINMTIIAIILINIISAFGYKVKQENRVVSSDIKLMASHSIIENVEYNKEVPTISKKITSNNVEVETTEVAVSNILIEETVDYSQLYPEIVYDGLSLVELGEKIERNLKSSLKGYGYVIASLAIEYDVDPYMALAIILHETGCNSGTCSTLVKKCNNVGGMKGGPNCGNGSYKKFSTLEQGIESFMRNLSNNYIKKGLKTPEAINRKYAESNSWSQKVKYYIRKIKNS